MPVVRPRLSLQILLAFLSIWSAVSLPAPAQTFAAADWQRVTELDAGPKGAPSSTQEARSVAAAHLGRQEKALRDFLRQHPSDEHVFEAKLRLSRALQIRAGLENSDALKTEALRILDNLAATASAEQRAEVDFARIAYLMRTMKGPTRAEREGLLMVARRFQADHPEDRRLARLLAEVATMFDAEPDTKRSLLISAQEKVGDDEELKRRVADDLLQLDWLGKPIAVHCTTMGGKELKLEDSRGKAVLLVFFASWSPPSLEAIGKLQHSLDAVPKEKLQVLPISLDNKPEELADAITKQKISWPVGFDGRGWASPLVRALGINSLPTVWLLDPEGKLRSLNALDGTADQILGVLRKPQ